MLPYFLWLADQPDGVLLLLHYSRQLPDDFGVIGDAELVARIHADGQDAAHDVAMVLARSYRLNVCGIGVSTALDAERQRLSTTPSTGSARVTWSTLSAYCDRRRRDSRHSNGGCR